jgi:hypothetical protein
MGDDSGSSSGGEAGVEGTSNCRAPLLPPGGHIMAGHSLLWTKSIEPGDDGLGKSGRNERAAMVAAAPSPPEQDDIAE